MPKETLKDQFGFKRAQLDILLSTLNQLIKIASQGAVVHQGCGICHNWDMLLPENLQCIDTKGMGYISTPYILLSQLAATWPLSKNPGKPSCWPIPSVPGYGPWEAKNLELRLDLMRYIAHRLRDWRRRTPA